MISFEFLMHRDDKNCFQINVAMSLLNESTNIIWIDFGTFLVPGDLHRKQNLETQTKSVSFGNAPKNNFIICQYKQEKAPETSISKTNIVRQRGRYDFYYYFSTSRANSVRLFTLMANILF